MIQGSLLGLWMHKSSNNNQTYNCCQQKNLLKWMNQQPNWMELVLHGEQDHNREKCESSHERHNKQHNNGKVTSLSFLLCVPVKLSNGVADKSHPNWLFGCSAWGTEPNSTQQLRCVGIQWRILFGLI